MVAKIIGPKKLSKKRNIYVGDLCFQNGILYRIKEFNRKFMQGEISAKTYIDTFL